MSEVNVLTSREISSHLTARDFIAPLFRLKRTLGLTFLLVFVGVLGITRFLGPSYVSRMEVLVNEERVDPVVSTQASTQMFTGANPVTPEEINSEVNLLGSSDVLEQVVLENGLAKDKGSSGLRALLPKHTEQERVARATKQLASQLKIGNVRNSNLIEVTYASPDPALAHSVLVSLTNLYLAKHIAVHRPTGSFEFFSEEAKKYRSELDAANSKLRSFGKEKYAAAPDEERTQLASQYATSVGLLHAAEQTIAGDEARIRNDNHQLGSTQSRTITLRSTAVNDKMIDDLNAVLIAAQTKRTQLALKYDPKYPLVLEADQEIAQAKAAIEKAESTKYTAETTDRDSTYELLREDIAKTESDLFAQRATLEATRRSIDNIQSQMVQLNEANLELQDLERDAKAAEGNYLLYLGKREQERSSNALDVTRISNVALAVPPSFPVLPVSTWTIQMLTAFVLAIFLSIGTAYALDYFDPSIRTPAHVSETLGIPVIVSITRKVA